LARRLEALDLVLEGPDGFEVRPVTDESYLPWYESEYHKFHLSNPHLKSWVAMSEREDLEKYRNQELLYGAYLGSELIGLIGGEERPLLGLSGLYLGELLISEKYKGKGFATQMQRLYLKSSLVNLRLFGERSMLAIFNPRRPLCVWVDCRCALNTL
jgi:RimJ/RimL family protein N-acetyltransferase